MQFDNFIKKRLFQVTIQVGLICKLPPNHSTLRPFAVMNRHYLHIPVKGITKVGVLYENARISRRFWRKLISLMSIWANYTYRLSTHLYEQVYFGRRVLVHPSKRSRQF